MKVLVTDAADRKTLASLRFLALAGAEVDVGGTKRFDQSLFSKYCRSGVLYPNPVKDAEAFAEFLLDYLAKNRFDCVLPMSDYTTLTLSKYRERFERLTHLSVPDHDILLKARDKPLMTEIAASLGVPTPKTICPENVEEVEAIAGELEYPVVIKYKRGTGAIGCRYAHSPAEVVGHYRTEIHSEDIVFDDTFPMIQEYVPGMTVDTGVLFDKGECRAAINTRRLKTMPPGGGWGVVNETFYDETLTDYAVRICEKIGYHGPGQVEFKKHAHTGRLYFIEVNCRFWGSIGAVCEAGLNIPMMAARLAVDGGVEPCFDYELGMFYRRPFPHEIRCALMGENRLEGLLDCLAFKPGARYDIWPSDPVPHIVAAAFGMYRGVRSTLKRLKTMGAA